MQRIRSLDLARGFTVLVMPSVHVCILYSRVSVQSSPLGIVLQFLAEGPGAQLFMFVMGVLFAFSRKENVLMRSFYLLLAGLGLNIVKFIIPLQLNLIPQNLLNELHLTAKHDAMIFFLFMGDIFHFAAIANLILLLISRVEKNPYWVMLFAVAMMLMSPLFWDLKVNSFPVDWILGLIGGHPPNFFFPLFPWIVYPTIGLSVGYLVNEYNASILKMGGIIGMVLVYISLLFPNTKPQGEWLIFYRTEAPDTIFHLGLVFTWIALFQWLTEKVKPNRVTRLLEFCSRHITTIYIIQWILICWCLAITGYGKLNGLQSVQWMMGITITTLLLTYAKETIRHYWNRHRAI